MDRAAPLVWSPGRDRNDAQGRLAFGPVSVSDVPSLVTAITDGSTRHQIAKGPVNIFPG